MKNPLAKLFRMLSTSRLGDAFPGLFDILAFQAIPLTRAGKRRVWALLERTFRQNTDVLKRQFYAGDITLNQWLDGFKQQIKDLHVGSAVVGKGGDWSAMTASDWGRVGAQCRRHYQHAVRFATDVYVKCWRGKPPSIEAFGWRSDLYAGGGGGTGRLIELISEGDPHDLMRWVRHLSDSCTTCIEREDIEVERDSITFWPRDGTSECGNHCGCEWELVERAVVEQ